ncbi:MAG: class I SAM-dependent methyltransferase [Spirochaetaceae bacterium]|nr:class I SAM-dependent methyltransferase [Myxococcales bacterium]MCB9726692.1 class I SAM-dependent methyltransferase [Spirochaetaceae bacterium]HPG25114.1 class I SAM-dependent methyltransferase [Myxococcota bacterium]
MSDPTADAPVKTLGLSAALHGYLVEHGTPPDAILRELTAETRERVGPMSMMQIAPEQGAFLTLMTRLIGARRAIEIGTFTGYSALCIARGLPADGKLLCCDVNEEWTSIGRRYWERAGVADRIDLRIAPALETLDALPADRSWDLAFVDAHKPEYLDYLERLVGLIRPGGLILVDNVLWNGQVLDERDRSAETVAIRAFNEAVAKDDRFDRAMVSISDGLTLLRPIR